MTSIGSEPISTDECAVTAAEEGPESSRDSAPPSVQRRSRGGSVPPPSNRKAAPESERRVIERVPCSLVLLDAESRVFRVEDIGPGGIKYSGPDRPPPGGHRLSLILPNSDCEIDIIARPAWARWDGDGWTVGARVECDDAGLRRLRYMFHTLAGGGRSDEVQWVPLSLVDATSPAEILRSVRAIDPGPAVAHIAALCDRVSHRPGYLWQWGHEALRVMTLSCVAPAWRDAALTTKLCVAVFFTTLDDIADEQRDSALFHEVRRFVLDERALTEGDARDPRLGALAAAWHFVLERVRALPRYDEFSACFRFDCATVVQSQAHALLSGLSPGITGSTEARFWTPNTYCMNLFADIDAMCSADLDTADFGAVRDMTSEAQTMWTLANWIGTWEREARVRDYSSGVFGEALRDGLVTRDELREAPVETIMAKIRSSDIDARLLAQWGKHWIELEKRRGALKGVDVSGYLRGVEQVLQLQLSSRGLV